MYVHTSLAKASPGVDVSSSVTFPESVTTASSYQNMILSNRLGTHKNLGATYEKQEIQDPRFYQDSHDPLSPCLLCCILQREPNSTSVLPTSQHKNKLSGAQRTQVTTTHQVLYEIKNVATPVVANDVT